MELLGSRDEQNAHQRAHRTNVAEQSDKPVFNEHALAKLLEAAYVVQEHNRATQPAPALAPRVEEVEKAAADAEAKTEAALARRAEPVASSERPAVETEPDGLEPEAVSSEPVSSAPVSAVSSAPIFSEPAASAVSSSEPASSIPALSTPVSAASAVDGSVAPVSRAAISAPVSATPLPKDDYATTLAQIVETQGEIRERILELKDPMALIVERVAQIARAGGAAIGIVEGANLRYRAIAGLMTPSAAEIPKEKVLCAVCLQSGHVVRCPNVDSTGTASGAVDVEQFRQRGIRAMIAVPVFHEGTVAGGLELYYSAANAFLEQDVHTAQLMAGLVTEVLAREEEVTRRKSLAGERALMLEALERLQPNLAALVDSSAAKSSAAKTTPAKVGATAAPAASSASSSTASPTPSGVVCRKCGHELLHEEQFCGKCGTPRSGDYEPPSMQSKVASMWHMQEALKKLPGSAGNSASGNGAAGSGAAPLSEPAPGFDDAEFQKMLSDSLEKEMPELFQPIESRAGKMWPETLEPAADHLLEGAKENHELAAAADDNDASEDEAAEKPNEEESATTTALAKPTRSLDWSSAASAREFLEQLAGQRSNGLARFWRARRGDFYLALAVVLVAIVIRWGIWSNHPVSATGTSATAAAQHRKAAPDADLSWLDRTLVKLGLAEAPAPAEYKGNPDAEVWIDLRTALYYCPGTDLYGKTPKGKFETQRDAQLDQFEPANRKACD